MVGAPAKNKLRSDPRNTIKSIKRHMGTGRSLHLGNEQFSPQEISAKILQKLKLHAEHESDREFNNVVITVPAYFDDRERRGTIDAATIAGFDEVKLLNEPCAAALAYNYTDDDFFEQLKNQHEAEQTVLVFDLGGGTLDVTIMHYSPKIHEVIATDGDTSLGGDDWDEAFLTYIAEKIEAETGHDPLNTDKFGLGPKNSLQKPIRNAKHKLSRKDEVDLEVPWVFDKRDDPVDENYTFRKTITRDEFLEATAHLLDRINEPLESALEAAAETEEVTKENLDEILLVGGATRMPQISNRIEEVTGIRPRPVSNPETIVARGAGIRGGIEGDELRGVAFRDVVPLPIGVGTRGNVFETIIPENTTVPEEQTRTFTNASDAQTSVTVDVYQGKRQQADANQHLQSFTLSGMPPAPAQTLQIRITFSVDKDGILTVEAKESQTGVSRQIEIKTDRSGMAADEIEEARKEAEQFAEEDQIFRQRREIRQEAEYRLQIANRIVANQSEVIGDALQRRIEEYLSELTAIVDRSIENPESVDYNRMKQASDELLSLIKEIGIDMYQPEEIVDGVETNQNIQVSGKAESPDDSAKASGDDSDTITAPASDDNQDVVYADDGDVPIEASAAPDEKDDQTTWE